MKQSQTNIFEDKTQIMNPNGSSSIVLVSEHATHFIPDEEWATVEAAAQDFWEEIAAESDVKRRVVDIFKKYNADMVKAGRPYRY